MVARQQDSVPTPHYNATTRAVVSSLGALLGISSISHGVLEIIQGNAPTPGSFVKALGPGHSWTLWVHGSEPAFTLFHNFLVTGVLATAMGFLLIIWSVRYIESRGGATVFLLISVASFLAGGGLAQVLLFTFNWAAATRIRATLGFWQGIMPSFVRRALARVWTPALIAAGILFMAALEIDAMLAQRGLQASGMFAIASRQQLLRAQIVDPDFVRAAKSVAPAYHQPKILGEERPGVEPLPGRVDFGSDAKLGFALLQIFAGDFGQSLPEDDIVPFGAILPLA